MAIKEEVYRCEICGIFVEVLEGGKGRLFCCGEPMKLQERKYTKTA